jgi:hypothetical protein
MKSIRMEAKTIGQQTRCIVFWNHALSFVARQFGVGTGVE